MVEVREDLNSWGDVFKYLAGDFLSNEERYVNSDNKNPDVIVPAQNVQNPHTMSVFNSAESKSFDLGANYVKRDTNSTCSLQLRAYKDGEHLYQNLGSSSGILGAKGVSSQVAEDYSSEKLYYIQLNWHNPMEGDNLRELVHNMVAHLFIDVLKMNIPGLTYMEFDSSHPLN